MDQAEASGKTVEDALNKALAKLGAHRDQVEFVVLDEGKRGGLFGRGAKDAVVRVERVANPEPLPATTQPPDTRIPHGTQGRGGRRGGGDRGNGGGRGGDRGGRPAAPDRGAAADRGGSSERGRGRRGPQHTQTRAGYDTAVPKLTDADFRKPRFDGGPAAEGETPAPAAPSEGRRSRGGRGGRGRRGGGGVDQPERAEGTGHDEDTGRDEGEPRPPRAERPRGERPERRRRDEEAYIEPDINAEEVDFAAQTVDDILRILEIDSELSIREPVTPGDGLGSVLAVIDIKGEDLGLLIGRRGETLLSLQYLVNLILARRYPGRGGVTIDVEYYRHRREEQVVSLAKRMADRVRETGAPITLEPMSASERRLIHLTFADDPDLETNSVGEGENRKVVISARR